MNTLGRRQPVTCVVAIAGLLAMVALPCVAKLLIAYADDDIRVYDVETRRHTTLTDHPARDGAPSWSGNGRQVAFVSDRNGSWDVYTMDADGSHVTQRTHTERREGGTAFSPDGRYIAFGLGRNDAGDFEPIAVLDMRAAAERFVTAGTGLQDTSISWFPDSERILFIRRANGFGIY